MICYLSMLLTKEQSSFLLAYRDRIGLFFFGQKALLVVRFYRFECLSRPEILIICYVLQFKFTKEIGVVLLHFVF